MKEKRIQEVKMMMHQRIAGMTRKDWAYIAANLALCAMPVASGRMIASSRRAIPTIGKLVKYSHPFIQSAVINNNSLKQDKESKKERS